LEPFFTFGEKVVGVWEKNAIDALKKTKIFLSSLRSLAISLWQSPFSNPLSNLRAALDEFTHAVATACRAFAVAASAIAVASTGRWPSREGHTADNDAIAEAAGMGHRHGRK
jgi:hypothetical protein